MKFTIFATLAAAAMGCSIATASAGQIQVTGYSLVGGGVNAHVSYAGSPSISNEYVGSGEIALTEHDLPSGPDHTLLVFCTDLFDVLYTPATYDVGTLASDHGKTGKALSATVLNEINALISHGTALLNNGFSAQVSSAIQLAIWSVEYGSAFSFSSDDGTVASLVSTYVADVAGNAPIWAADPSKIVAQITSPTGTATADQGLSYLADLPEPGSLSLMTGALLASAFTFRPRAARRGVRAG